MTGEESGGEPMLPIFQTGPCFICQIVARKPDYPAHIVYEDDIAIAFLDKYPSLCGWTLVAPREHREQVTADFEDSIAQ
jgi:diadenosine tetraphosphate (Ap4A) HIT family hydrolase